MPNVAQKAVVSRIPVGLTIQDPGKVVKQHACSCACRPSAKKNMSAGTAHHLWQVHGLLHIYCNALHTAKVLMPRFQTCIT